MSVRRVVLGIPLAAGLFLVPGCGAAPDDAAIEALGTAGDAIQGGYADTTDKNAVGVGLFQQGNLYGICTGSLIAPNVVLTARHCVADVLNDANGVDCTQTMFSPNHAPADMGVTTQPQMSAAQDKSYHKVREIVTPTDPKFCGQDQAILILEDNLAPAEAAPLVPRVDSEISKKDQYYAIGYGATVDDMSGTGAGTRRRRDNLFVSCPGAQCDSVVMQAVKPTEFVGDKGICEGDSGGPALDLQNRVIGITSRGEANCSSPVYSDVFGVGQWVKDTTIHGAELGQYDPPPWAKGFPTDPQFSYPIGDVCKQPGDCVSNNCVADGVATYCTRPCNTLGTCPDGYSCDTKDTGVCLQDHPPPDVTPKSKSSGCSFGRGDDPTKPVPWFTLVAALAVVALRRRRR